MLRRGASLLVVWSVLILGCSPSGAGVYVNESDEDQYIELRSDGSFYMEEQVEGAGPCMFIPGCSYPESFAGTYSLEGVSLVLAGPLGETVRARLVGDNIICHGQRWIKGGTGPTNDEVAKF